MVSESKKLFRSRANRLIGGVCAGLGEYFGIDPTVVRVVFVLGALLGVGSFVVLYIILLLIVPEEPYSGSSNLPSTPPPPSEPPQVQ